MIRKKTPTPRTTKKFWEMTPAEMTAAAKEYDREFIIDSSEPLTSEMAAQWRRAKRKPGRPRIGAGSKAISVTIEQSLLREVDRIARRRKTTRARLIAHGLRAVIDAERRAAG